MEGRVLPVARKNDWLFIAGMACYWPAFRNSFFGLIFVDPDHGPGRFDGEYLLLLGCMAVLCIGCLMVPSVVHRLLAADRRLIPALSVLGSGGLAFAYVAKLAVLPEALMVGSVLCAAVAFLALTFAWFNECVAAQGRNILFYLALSFFLSFVLSLTSLLPTPASLALPLLSWIVSGAAYAAYQPAPTSVGSTAALGTRPNTGLSLGLGKDTISGLVILLVAFLVIGALVRGFLYSGTVSYSPSQGTYSRRALSLVLALIIVVIAYRADAGKPPLFRLWALVSLIFFGGLFLVGSLYSFMPELASGVVISGRTFVTLFLWVALMIAIRQKGLALVPTLGFLFILVECVSGFCSYFVAPSIARAIDLPASAYLPPFALLMAFILIASTLAFLALTADKGARDTAEGQAAKAGGAGAGTSGNANGSAGAVTAPGTDASDPLSREVVCALLGEQHGLTEREVEVMVGFSQGNSLRKVAESLFISMSTAQTHVKSLYRKLGIHSKQELIDLVSTQMSRTDTTAR